MQLLRELPGRRVWREGDVVFKSFERHGTLLGWLDRRRARRELDVLARLAALGLPVPTPLGLERGERGWRARIQWLAGTHTLLDHLVAEVPHRAAPDRAGTHGADRDVRRARRAVVRAAAVALARFGAAGLDQPDWHPANLLIDDRARPFGIDFHKARITRPCARLLERDALLFAVHGRELTDRRERALALATYLEALPTNLAHALLRGRTRSVFAQDLEARARGARQGYVVRELDRWLRTSGAAIALEGGVVRARREPPADAAVFLVTGAPAHCRAAWLAQARAVEHRLPAAAPVLLDGNGARFAIAEAARAATSQAALATVLADRGFNERDNEPYTQWTAPNGTVHLVPIAARRL